MAKDKKKPDRNLAGVLLGVMIGLIVGIPGGVSGGLMIARYLLVRGQ